VGRQIEIIIPKPIYILVHPDIFYSTILVFAFTYIAMPFLSRLLRRWLYPRKVQHPQDDV